MDERLVAAGVAVAVLALCLCSSPKKQEAPGIDPEVLSARLDECSQMGFLEDRDNCYHRLIIETPNVTLCERINDVAKKRDCRAKAQAKAAG